MKFKVVTTCDAISEYIVEAKNSKEAEERFFDGEFLEERITDYQNENIDTVTPIN